MKRRCADCGQPLDPIDYCRRCKADPLFCPVHGARIYRRRDAVCCDGCRKKRKSRKGKR